MKLLTASSDDYNKKHILGVSSSRILHIDFVIFLSQVMCYNSQAISGFTSLLVPK